LPEPDLFDFRPRSSAAGVRKVGEKADGYHSKYLTCESSWPLPQAVIIPHPLLREAFRSFVF